MVCLVAAPRFAAQAVAIVGRRDQRAVGPALRDVIKIRFDGAAVACQSWRSAQRLREQIVERRLQALAAQGGAHKVFVLGRRAAPNLNL